MAFSAWHLDKAQVAQFFASSRRYQESMPHAFYDLPCTISGTLTADGKRWGFTINAGGTAVWRNGSEQRYWGCNVTACETLVLLTSDGMDPDRD